MKRTTVNVYEEPFVKSRTVPDCTICAQLKESELVQQIPKRHWITKIAAKCGFLLLRQRHIGNASVKVVISPILDTYFNGRNTKTIFLCSKHQRMMLKALDTLIDED